MQEETWAVLSEIPRQAKKVKISSYYCTTNVSGYETGMNLVDYRNHNFDSVPSNNSVQLTSTVKSLQSFSQSRLPDFNDFEYSSLSSCKSDTECSS